MNLRSLVRVFGIGKKQTYAVYGEDPEGDGIPEKLSAFREMSLRSIGKTNWAGGPPKAPKSVQKKNGALTTNEIQPGQNRGK
jgi:hypothetical protein